MRVKETFGVKNRFYSLKKTDGQNPLQPVHFGRVERPVLDLPNSDSFGVKFGTTHFPTKDEVRAINTVLFIAPDDPNLIIPDYRASRTTQFAIRRAINFPTVAIPEKFIRVFKEEKRKVVNFQNFTKGRPPIPSFILESRSRSFFREIKSNVPRVINTLRQLGVSDQGLELFKTFLVIALPMMELAGHAEAVPHSLEVAENCAVLARKLGASDGEVLQVAIGGIFHDGLKLPPAISFMNLSTHPPVVHAASSYILLQNPEMRDAIGRYLDSSASSISTETFAKPISDALIINNDSKWVTVNVIAKTFREGLLGTKYEHLIPQIENLLLRRFEAISTGESAPQFTPEMLKAMRTVKFETGLSNMDRSVVAEAIYSLAEEHSAVLPGRIVPTEAVLNGMLIGSSRQQKAFRSALLERLESTNAIRGIDVTGEALLGNSCEMPRNIVAQVLGDIDQLSLRASKILRAEYNGPTYWHGASIFMRDFNNNVNGVSPASKETAQLRQRNVYVGILHALEEITGNNLTQNLPPGFATLPVQEQSRQLWTLIIGDTNDLEPSRVVRARWTMKNGIDLSASRDPSLLSAIREHEDRAVKNGELVYQELLDKIASRTAEKLRFAF